MKKRILSLFMCAVMLFGTFALTSCYFLDSSILSDAFSNDTNSPLTNATINVEGGDNYDITIESSKSENMLAANKALLSAVSIYSEFSKKSYGSTVKYSSAGSGVIYKLDKERGDAYIITNYHVVHSSSATTANRISNNISIFLYGHEATSYAIPATYIGGSMHYDLAVLKVTANDILMKSNATAANFADSNEIAVLDTAIAIGNPEGGGISATLGYVNVESEYITMVGSDDRTEISLRVIRTDAAVNSGNSGGGLFNSKGEVIGIVNAKVAKSSVDSIGYAIPSNVAKNIAENIIYYCDGTDRESVYRCIVGITVESVDLYTKYDTETGKVYKCEKVMIQKFEEDSFVKDILKVGDTLLSVTVDGKTDEITRRYHLIDSLLNARPDSKVTFKISRGGEEMEFDLTITTDMLKEYV